MSAWRVIAAIGLLSMLGGCSNTPTGQPAPDTSDQTTASETASDNGTTGEPAPEPTGTESAQPTRRQPSIHLTGAPIGPGVPSNPPADQAKQCTGVSLTDVTLRNGTTLTLGSPSLDPEGVFVIDQSGCGDQSPSCSGYTVRPDSDNGCFVGVRQTTNQGDQHVTLNIPADATCATDADCNSLTGHGGSQIGFDSRDLGPTQSTESPTTESPQPSESPSETSSDSPTESPSEAPSGTPSTDG